MSNADPQTGLRSGPEAEPPRRRREPIINAPLIVLVMGALLVALHTGFAFSPYEEQVRLVYEFALVPSRFHAEAGSDIAYPSMLHAALSLVSTSLLHADWMHVIVNALMLLAFGTPVARALGAGGFTGAGKWMLLYVVAVTAGSAAYLALNTAGGYAVGASGGTSGLIAAAFLLDPYGRVTSLLTRRFLSMTFVFILINVILVVAGPALLGMGIAWEAHAGGYVAGALMMLLLGRRARPEATLA